MLVFKQLKSLIKNNRSFVIMLIVIQMTAVFSVLFIAGVIIDSKCMVAADGDCFWATARFENDVYYGQLEKDVIRLSKNIPGRSFDIFLIYNQEKIVGDYISSTDIFAYSNVTNGKYKENYYNSIMKYGILDGRYFNEQEIMENKFVAIANLYPMKYDSITIHGKEYSFVGKIYDQDETSYTSVVVPIASFKDIPIKFLKIETEMVLDDKICNEIRQMFDKNFAGQYEFEFSQEHKSDVKSLYKTVAIVSCFMMIIVIGMMIRIYSYILKDNLYTMGVWKLLGSSHLKVAGNFTLQMLLVTLPSLLVGYGLFAVLNETWFVRLYPYMNVYCTGKVCLGIVGAVFAMIMISYFLCSLVNTRGKIRNIIR